MSINIDIAAGLGGSGDPGGALAGGGTGPLGTNTVSQSLRFNGSNEYLSKNDFGTATDTNIRTFSTWIKQSDLSFSNYDAIIGCANSGIQTLSYYSDNTIGFYNTQGGTAYEDNSAAVFRDIGAWFHIFFTYSHTANEMKLYINGSLTKGFSTGTHGPLEKLAETGHITTLMKRSNAGQYVGGYLAETVLLDGYVGDINDFAEDINGIWVPKNISAAGLTYGTNGFYLDYADSSDLGKDVSGQGNHFTSQNLAAEDQVPDSPTNNFATWNPLDNHNYNAPSEGNLRALTAGNNGTQNSTFAVSSGKWYWEARNITAGPGSMVRLIGIAKEDTNITSTPYSNSDCYLYYSGNGNKYNGSSASYGDSWDTDGDIIGVAFDADNGALWFSKNGTWQNSATAAEIAAGTTTNAAFTGLSGTFVMMVSKTGGTSSNDPHHANFGQDSTFAADATTGSANAADGNGIGDFYYTPPSGFLALCSANLPEPTIGPNSDEQADDYFETILYTGNGGTQHIGSGGVQHPQDTTTIANSLVFNRAGEHELARTFGSGGNRRKWTFSTWIKRTALLSSGNDHYIFGTNTGAADSTFMMLVWRATDALAVTGQSTLWLKSNNSFGDTSGWYHIVWVLDSDNATNAEKMRLYVDGTEITSFASDSRSSLSGDQAVNAAVEHNLGVHPSATGYGLDAYLADTIFVDGQAYGPEQFGQVGSNGYWIPKAYSGTYGTTGFRLTYEGTGTATTADGTTAQTNIGDDQSGSGRNFSVIGSTIDSHDVKIDSPTRNFATLSPSRVVGSPTLSEGNLKLVGSGADYDRSYATFSLTSGKWYAEFRYLSGDNRGMFGVVREDSTSTDATNVYIGSKANQYGIDFRARAYTNSTELFDTTDFSAGDIGLLCFDIDNNKLWFGRRDISGATTIWYDNAGANNGDPSAGTNPTYTGGFTGHTWLIGCHDYNGTNIHTNFGADGSFAGGVTSGGLSDANGFGDFNYIEDGFLALVDDNIPQEGLESPDFVWIKSRSSTYNHVLWDTVRGATKQLISNTTGAESTQTSGLTSFDYQGFTIGSNNNLNNSGSTYVAWTWKAGGTAPTKTYKVVVDSDGGQNKYRFRNSDDDATFATYAPTIELQEGGTYVFDWSDDGTNGAVSAQGHPIRFSTTSNGTWGGGSEYTTGVVKDNSAYKTTITVASGAPTLYYYCQNHSGMGGQANTNTTHGSSNFV